MSNEEMNPALRQTDVSGSVVLKVENDAIKVPKHIGIIKEITYGNMKAKILAIKDDNILLEFWHKDKPTEVKVDWVSSEHCR